MSNIITTRTRAVVVALTVVVATVAVAGIAAGARSIAGKSSAAKVNVYLGLRREEWWRDADDRRE